MSMLTDTRADVHPAGDPLPGVPPGRRRLARAGSSGWRRWCGGSHPTEGLISPDLLIPAAEASGDIGPLTRWIADRRLRAGLPLVAEHPARGQLHGRAAAARRGVRGRGEALRQTGFPSDQLNIEVTEDAIVDPTASADLQAISRHGRPAVGGRRRHQLVVLRALQAPRHQHGQDRRLVRRRARVQPGDQPTGRRDGHPHGPLPRDVGHRRAGRECRPGAHRPPASVPTPPRGSSSPSPCRADDARRPSPPAPTSPCSHGPRPRRSSGPARRGPSASGLKRRRCRHRRCRSERSTPTSTVPADGDGRPSGGPGSKAPGPVRRTDPPGTEPPDGVDARRRAGRGCRRGARARHPAGSQAPEGPHVPVGVGGLQGP